MFAVKCAGRDVVKIELNGGGQCFEGWAGLQLKGGRGEAQDGGQEPSVSTQVGRQAHKVDGAGQDRGTFLNPESLHRSVATVLAWRFNSMAPLGYFFSLLKFFSMCCIYSANE
jgi:hypothetical protein